MKLHLPKALMAAVVAAVCFASGAAYATDYTVSGTQTLSELTGGTALTANDTIAVSTGNTLTYDSVNNTLGALNITGGTVNVTAGGSSNGFMKGGTVSVTNGGALNIDLKDTFGWSTAQGPSAVTLNNAAMTLKARQTWGVTNLNLQGNAHIAVAENPSTDGDAPALNTLGSNLKINVSGDNNVIDVGIRLRDGVTIANSGQLTFNGNVYNDPYASPSHALTFNLSGSSQTTITGDIDTGTQVSVHEGGGTLTFGGGSGTRAYLNRLEMGDSDGGTNASTLNVKSGYTLAITGSNNGEEYKSASLLLGEWTVKTTANIEGKLLAENACLSTGNNGGIVNIENGGVLAVQGIKRAKVNNTNMSLTLKEGGTLVLGSAGITFEGGGTKSFDLQGGTLGISADSSEINVALTVSGAVTVDTNKYVFSESGGAIAAGTAGGKLILNGGLSGAGTLTTAGSGTLQLGAITANTDINDAAGVLCLSGTLTMGGSNTLTLGSVISIDTAGISNFTGADSATYVDLDGNVSTGYGFLQGTYTLVTGGTIDGSASLKIGSGTTTTTIDNANRTFALDKQIYYTGSSGTESLDAIQTAAGGALQRVNVSGGTLNVDANLTTGQSIDVHANSTLAIAEGTVLEKSSVNIDSGAVVTLTGAGEYVAGSMTPGATLGSDWTGIVSISGTCSGTDLNNALFGNASSKIRLDGVSGWIAYDKDVTRELLMGTDAAGSNGLKITAMSDGRWYKFSGKITGSGVFEVADDQNATATIEFSGDISGWDGTVKKSLAGSNAKTVKFTGNATTVNVDVETAAGTANVVFDNASAVTMNGTISGSGTTNLTTSGAGTKTFTKDVTVNNASLSGGSASFANLTVGGTLTLSGTENLDVTGTLALNGATLNLTGLNITATSDEQVITLANVGTLAGGSVTVTGLDLGDRKWSLQNANGTVVLASGGTVGEFSGVSAASLADSLQLIVAGYTAPVELTATSVLGYNAATATLDIAVGDLSGLTGKDFNVTVGEAVWQGIVTAMSGVDGGVYNNATITLNGEALTGFGTVSFNGYAGTGTQGEYFVAYIPEPTTGTLSVLALAALALRRRRK